MEFSGRSICHAKSYFEYEKPGLKTARLIVDDINLCKDTLIKTINYFPVPSLLVIEPNTFTGCQPASIFLIISVHL
ncbi:MAG: hypothetical protein IPP49_16535 [Saprospiraceae bacterium]|nr:hypothetical protein [Saprospiraceae bacterium]